MKSYIFPDPLDAHCELQPDAWASPIVGLLDKHPANGADCQSFDVSQVPNKQGATLTITKSGFAPYVLHGILDVTVPTGFLCDVFRLQKAGGVRPFQRDGHFCRYSDDGTEMLINESTGFRLFARWRAGETAADAFAQSCVDHRINMVRVSGLQDTSLYLSDPALQYRIFPEGSKYYQDLADFIDWCATYGLYLDFVCCIQTQTLLPDPAAQRAHVQQVFEVFHDRAAFVSEVNEQGEHDNSVDGSVLTLPKPTGATFLLSRGSRGAGNELAIDPVADLVELHLNDVNEWQRKGHNAWEMANRYNAGGYVSETTRTDKDPNLYRFTDDAKTQIAMTLAALIHTPEGKNADPFGASLAHLDAHNQGVFDGGVHFRRGQYGRQDCAALRCYSMTTSSPYAWQVRA